MKVVISAQSSDIDAMVDPRFGRARWFIVADTESGEWQAHDNAANVDASGGAGVQAGSTVASHDAEAVITGNVGPNAHKVLAAANIAIYQVSNGASVSDALAALARGELKAVEAPTVSGHWT
ncbi:MAG TPA: NifB/NifX family molybdenum-iron cluster-binding protein [Thermoleophilia bacterium]|nr:NifB/NifX family molybdenum-iron cluster-binding protein [Thermoleophilia bacterium]